MSLTTAGSAPQVSLEERSVRVFVSSVFRDMREEREELGKYVFPALRHEAEAREIAFVEVDLRWGITDEAKAEGQVLPVCLAEIDACRPYLICVLGDEYGWIPESIPLELLRYYPWLQDLSGSSITEIEIVHGALRQPEAAAETRFYFRHSHKEDPRLRELKRRIEAAGLPVRRYTDRHEFRGLVLEDWRAILERRFPDRQGFDPLGRAAADHRAFAISRTRAYVSRHEYMERLDRHVHEDGPPLVVSGEPGSGKSALLANWLLTRCPPESAAIVHFTHASADASNAEAMLDRLARELAKLAGRKLDPGGLPEDAFADVLEEAAARTPLILIIDGLNQLDPERGALDLVWLPHHLPARTRLILSTTPGVPLDALHRRGWPEFALSPLDKDERSRLASAFLRIYAKALPDSDLERIIAAEQSANPLFLRAVLEELRVWGEHEGLRNRITHYLKSGTAQELFERILERWEEDYESTRPSLVRDAMSLVWGARRGILEADLLLRLGGEEESDRLPGAIWSPLAIAAREVLINRAGVLTFAHAHVRAAVEHRYLSTKEARVAVHRELARPRGGDQRDWFTETAWQEANAEQWDDLYFMLARPSYVAFAQAIAPSVLRWCWVQLERNTAHRLKDTYLPWFENVDAHHLQASCLPTLAQLLIDFGHFDEGRRCFEILLAQSKASGTPDDYRSALANYASASRIMSGSETALTDLRKAREVVDSVAPELLIVEAQLLIDGGRVDEAEQSLRSLRALLPAQVSLATAANVTRLEAALLLERGQLDAALEAFQDAERIGRMWSRHEAVCGGLLGQARVHWERGDYKAMKADCDEADRSAAGMANRDFEQEILGYRGVLLQAEGRFDAALAAHRKQEEVARSLGRMSAVAAGLLNQSRALRHMGSAEAAMAKNREAESVCRELKLWSLLASCLAEQGDSLAAQPDGARTALARLAEVESFAAHLPAVLAMSLFRRARIHEAIGEADEAARLTDGAIDAARQSGNPQVMAVVLGDASLFPHIELHDAKRLASEALESARHTGNNELTANVEATIELLDRCVDEPAQRLLPRISAKIHQNPAALTDAWLSVQAHTVRLLLDAHKRAFEAEMGGRYGEARFLWREFHAQLQSLWDRDHVWNSAAQDGNGAQIRDLFVRELFLEAHCSFMNGSAELSERAAMHLEYALALAARSSLTERVRLATLGSKVDQWMGLLFKAHRLDEAVRFSHAALACFPNSPRIQDRVLLAHHLRITLRSTLRTWRRMRRGIREMERLRRRFPECTASFRFMSQLYNAHACQHGKRGRTDASWQAAYKSFVFNPRALDAEPGNRIDEAVRELAYVKLQAWPLWDEHDADLPAEALASIEQRRWKSLDSRERAVCMRARNLWEVLGFDFPRLYADVTMLRVHQAVVRILRDPPQQPSEIASCWEEQRRDAAELWNVDARPVCTWITFRAFGEQQYPPFPQLRWKPRLQSPAVESDRSLPPLGRWLFSRHGMVASVGELVCRHIRQ